MTDYSRILLLCSVVCRCSSAVHLMGGWSTCCFSSCIQYPGAHDRPQGLCYGRIGRNIGTVCILGHATPSTTVSSTSPHQCSAASADVMDTILSIYLSTVSPTPTSHTSSYVSFPNANKAYFLAQPSDPGDKRSVDLVQDKPQVKKCKYHSQSAYPLACDPRRRSLLVPVARGCIWSCLALY